jgi:putative transposase/transposase-like zinc-binding protein
MSTILTAPTVAARPTYEVADIFRQYGAAYRDRHPLSLEQQRVMTAIERCRTAALGGHLEQCDQCGHQRPIYNSCRNRHCPKCQGLARVRWLADRQAELLPVGYFHNVFTLPHEFNDLLAANQRLLYNLLFHSASATLQAFAAKPDYGLGGQLGFTAVLHTWDQKLLYHVHLHCVIAGGALAWDRSRWLGSQANYLFPVRELSADFRQRYLAGVRRAFTKKELYLPGRLAPLAEPAALAAFLDPLANKAWVVYSQPPFGGATKVLEYLSRYTHRVALSNSRLQAIADVYVTFSYHDRRDHNRHKQLTVPAAEFIRRFLLHVTPPGLCRMRHYGFLSNRSKEEQLPRCRALLGQAEASAAKVPSTVVDLLLRLTGHDVTRCPHCGQGSMLRVQLLPKIPPAEGSKLAASTVDSS